MTLTVFSIGILFNAFVAAFVSGTALALVLFLRQRWARLDLTMQAYTWFWWFTALVWFFSAIRYISIGFGYVGPWVSRFDIIVQSCVFFTGPALTYYATMRVFRKPALSDKLSSLSFALGCIAIWFLFLPNGAPIRDVTFFSAEATVNSVSFIIFSIEASLLLALLIYDIVIYMQRWRTLHARIALYEALYSAAIVVYVGLGTVDESKIITDWPLVIFRLLYTGSFLFIYLVIVQHDASTETYLTETTSSSTPTYG